MLYGPPTGTDEQECSLSCKVAAPASKPPGLHAHAARVLPQRVQDVCAKSARAERAHAVACERVGCARERARARSCVPAMLCPRRWAKWCAQTAPRGTRRDAPRHARGHASRQDALK